MKVVVTYAPAGVGHQRASEAVVEAIHRLNPNCQTILINALDGSDPFYRWAFTKGYQLTIERMPLVWMLLYHFSDIRLLSRWAGRIHRLSNARHAQGLARLFNDLDPDVIIGTHFLPMEVAGFLKAQRAIGARVISVLTDYLPHRFWISEGIDAYVVAGPLSKEELIRRGVPASRIHPLGIPIMPAFLEEEDRTAVAQRLGLDPQRFTVLLISGGLGTGPMAALVKAFLHLSEKLQLIVVCGKNQALLHTLERLRPTIPHKLILYGFTHSVHTLMSVADVVVTKPGGLTCAEALAKGLPMVFLTPIPGQEVRNARYLVSEKVALWVSSPKEAVSFVDQLRRHPDRLDRLRREALRIAKPQAAWDIARLAITLCKDDASPSCAHP
jgi:processive 1,2-diacylglycerol beta-glucosyltransferase